MHRTLETWAPVARGFTFSRAARQCLWTAGWAPVPEDRYGRGRLERHFQRHGLQRGTLFSLYLSQSLPASAESGSYRGAVASDSQQSFKLSVCPPQVAKRRPDLVPVLLSDFYNDRKGEVLLP